MKNKICVVARNKKKYVKNSVKNKIKKILQLIIEVYNLGILVFIPKLKFRQNSQDLKRSIKCLKNK